MSYIAPYIDAAGMHVPTYDDIKQHIIESFQTIYGQDIYLDNDSQDYQLISSLSLILYDACQTALMVYNNTSPSFATGASLDRLCSINGISRKEMTYSVAQLTITGEVGTTISYGTVRDQNDYIWALPAEVVIPEGGTIDVLSTCVAPGNIQAPANTINIINTEVYGWNEVTNPLAAIGGDPYESDAELRSRREKAVTMPSLSILGGILAHIQTLTDVGRIKGYENDTNEIVNNIPAHSICIVVEDGDQDEIAGIIYLRKTPGTGTYGDVSIVVDIQSGIPISISFQRPVEANLTITATIGELSSYSAEIESQIKQNIVNYVNGLDIAATLYGSNLIPIMMKANPDLENLAFYVGAVTLNGNQNFANAGQFGIFNIDANDITLTALT